MGKKIKKTAIIAGAAVGGVIGGTISLVGKLTNQKLVDDIGSSIVDSTILTGEIVGDAASGTADVVSGMVTKKEEKITAGQQELKQAGQKVVGNVVTNVKNLAHQGGEIGKGVVTGDKERAVQGVKTMGKMVAVGMLTVGAVKIEEPEAPERPEGPDVPETSAPPAAEAIREDAEIEMKAADDGEDSEREA